MNSCGQFLDSSDDSANDKLVSLKGGIRGLPPTSLGAPGDEVGLRDLHAWDKDVKDHLGLEARWHSDAQH